jgi:hypothetical protein
MKYPISHISVSVKEHFDYYHYVDTSAGGLLVTEGIILSVVIVPHWHECILLYFISIINDVTFDLYHISFMIVSRVWRYQKGNQNNCDLLSFLNLKGNLS